MIGSVTIQLPETWGSEDCGHQLSSSHFIGVSFFPVLMTHNDTMIMALVSRSQSARTD